MTITIHPMPTEIARAYQSGAPDCHGNPPERHISDGGGNPCRHCLSDIPAGAGMLILGFRPFGAPQPYAESGPIFLCADQCERFSGADLPTIFAARPEFLIKGYYSDERIAYGTGEIVPGRSIPEAAGDILNRSDIAFVDVRSARNNCFQARITRAGESPPQIR